MIVERTPPIARAALPLLLLCSFAGCSMFKHSEETQAIINKNVTGMSVGDFFQRYGRWRTRSEQLDGSTDYNWASALGPTPNAGVLGLDDRVCTLHIVATRDGKIATADIVLDNPGRVSTSRCREVFDAK